MFSPPRSFFHQRILSTLRVPRSCRAKTPAEIAAVYGESGGIGAYGSCVGCEDGIGMQGTFWKGDAISLAIQKPSQLLQLTVTLHVVPSDQISYGWYDKLWGLVMKAVPKVDESESGQMVLK